LARNIDPTLGVTVTGGSAEAAVSEAKRKERGATLDSALTNPLFQSQLNPKAALSEKLKSSGFEEDEIRLMTNKEAGSEYRDQQLRAQESVEKLLEGERPPLYQGASVVFVQQILDSAKSFTDGDGPEHERLIAYANAHIPIAAKNSALDAVSKVRLSGFSAVSALDQPSPVQDAEAPEQPDPQEMMDSLITNRRP
jgi:hypothetical protein